MESHQIMYHTKIDLINLILNIIQTGAIIALVLIIVHDILGERDV